MTAKTSGCPACGATLEFAGAATLFVVCRYCGGASRRTDVRLELIGKVAELAPIQSPLSLGARGRFEGRGFTAVGQVQLDHGAGPWNEWCLLDDDGAATWLAEAQGELLLTKAVALEGVRLPEGLEPGDTVDLGSAGRFTAAEIGQGRVVAARGEFPVEIAAGETFMYCDLRGENGGFATVTFDEERIIDSCFAGRRVTLEELALDSATVEAPAERRVAARKIGCPRCAAPIDVRDPVHARRVACEACGAILDPSSEDLAVLGVSEKLRAKPRIPVGARGRLSGSDMEVLAFLVRSVTVEGKRWPWHEYLLRRADGAYRWLVDARGHWTFVEPLDVSAVTRQGLVAKYHAETYRHFSGGLAVVDHVQGEVYWEVAVGETVMTDDFVRPPRMLSFEKTGAGDCAELNVSLATHVDRESLAAAFGLKTPLPRPSGVGPAEPNPADPRALLRRFAILAACLLGLFVFFRFWERDAVVLRTVVTPPAVTAAPAATESAVFFSEEFRLEPARANVAVRIAASVRNGWIGVDGALVNLDTGDVDQFSVDAERWSGVEGGESWSEGSGRGTAFIGSVPAGRYALRLDPAAEQGGVGVPCVVEVRSQVPSTVRPFLILLVLALPPVFSLIRRAAFEARRWSESDHAS